MSEEHRLTCDFSGRTPKDYLVSIGNRESEWAKRYGGPRPVRFPHVVNFPGIKDPAEYMQLLDQYMTVASGLLGGDTQSELNRPTLRHPGNMAFLAFI